MPNYQWYGNYKCAQCAQEYNIICKRENRGYKCPKCGVQNRPSINVSNAIESTFDY